MFMRQNTHLCQLVLTALLVTVVASMAYSAGFGLYEASSPTYALGGTVLGRAVDASANFYNPATLTDLTHPTVTLGMMTEHPRGRIKVNDGNTADMNPGVYVLPHLHLALPLPGDLTFGLGMMPEYGLGSKYNSSWDLAFNSQKTEVTSVTINPNLAYKIGDFLSIGVGLRFLYFDFEQESEPVRGLVRNRLKGDNEMKDFGWQAGVKWDVVDWFSVGLVYKSQTLVHVDGKIESETYRGSDSGDAWTEITLPQSLTAGFNWDVIQISEALHFGGTVSWTEWSSVDTLQFHLPATPVSAPQVKPINLRWQDTWRFALSPSWDFTENWTVMGSYVYESDCNGSQDSTMLPPSQRHMISLGLLWRISENVDLSCAYGVILMDEGESDCTDVQTGRRYRYHAERGISHATGLTVTYRF